VGPRAARVATALLYLGLALASTWPLASRLDAALPQGTDRAATVPLFQAWSIWWTSDRVAAGFEGFWDAPIFFPTTRSFVFSDPVLLEGFAAAPLFAAGASPALAHNAVLLLALVLNGGFALGLLRAVGLAAPAAAAGGAMMVMLPYVHHELGVLMLVPLAGILGTIWALARFARRPSAAGGLALGLAAAATYLLCGQYGVFLVLVVAPSAAWLARRELLAPRPLLWLLLGALLCAVLLAPLVSVQLEALGEHGFRRGERLALASSSHPTAWLATPWPALLPIPGVPVVEEVWMQAHFPGAGKVALALLGLAWGLRRPEWRRWTAFLLTASVAAALFSALPRLEVGELSPYRVLHDRVPGLAQMRSYWRFIVVTQIGVVLLAAQGLHALLAAARAPGAGEAAPARRSLASAAVVALGLVAAVELWPARQNLAPVPDLAAWRPWSEWVEEQVDPEQALVYLPFPASSGVADYEETSRWMYLGALHRRRMVNGYSGFFPRPYRALAKLLRGCPEPGAYDTLAAAGLGTLVIRSSWLGEHPGCGPPEASWRREFHADALDVEIHRRAPREAAALPPRQLRVAAASFLASSASRVWVRATASGSPSTAKGTALKSVTPSAARRARRSATADSSPTTATAPGLAARSRSRTRR
jgi:hypothetical protein